MTFYKKRLELVKLLYEKYTLKFREQIKRVFKFIRQLFCQHHYVLVDQNEEFPNPEPGEMNAIIRPNICRKCDHQIMLGSGLTM